jgi:hypothetical protein
MGVALSDVNGSWNDGSVWAMEYEVLSMVAGMEYGIWNMDGTGRDKGCSIGGYLGGVEC